VLAAEDGAAMRELVYLDTMGAVEGVVPVGNEAYILAEDGLWIWDGVDDIDRPSGRLGEYRLRHRHTHCPPLPLKRYVPGRAAWRSALAPGYPPPLQANRKKARVQGRGRALLAETRRPSRLEDGSAADGRWATAAL
jgi:hypothetical protein